MNSPRSRNSHSDPIQEIAYGVRHDLYDDPLHQSLLRAYRYGAADDTLIDMLLEPVRQMKTRELFGEVDPYRMPRLDRGDLVLGKDLRGQPVRIPSEWLRAGLLLVGNTGSGKSAYLSFLLPQIAASGCTVWVSEMYKTQLRHLRPLFGSLGKDLIVLRPRDWKWNLYQAGNRDPRAHLTLANDLLVRVLGLSSRAASILQQAGYALYQQYGIWDGRTGAWPTLYEVYEWVCATAGLNPPARESILDRLGAMLQALGPRCAAYHLAWDPTDLGRHCIDFEMCASPENVKQILLESQLFPLFQYVTAHGVVNGPLSQFNAFEDSQRFFADDRQANGELAPMDELAGVIRGCRIGLGVITQSTHGLSRRLVPNLATKIMGRLGCHEDYVRLGADMAMSPQQIDWASRHLKPGLFIAQASEGDWREPFVVQAPLLKIPSVVNDAEAAQSVKALDGLPAVPAREYDRWQPRHEIATASAAPVPPAPPDPPRLTDAERRFLEAVVREPGRPSSYYTRSAGMSGKRAAQVRRRLAAAGYLREHELATGQRGRNALVLEPLDGARDALRNTEI